MVGMEINREGWLAAMTDALRPLFEVAGYPLPDKIAVSVGFPSRRALANQHRIYGQCWRPETTEDGTSTVFVSPLLSGEGAAGVLAHELAHAATPGAGHKGAFVACCKAVGLTDGPPTSVNPGPELAAILKELAEPLGAYAHSPITPLSVPAKQSTRMLKVVCGDCGYTLRTTQKWLDIGVPSCCCGAGEMDVDV